MPNGDKGSHWTTQWSKAEYFVLASILWRISREGAAPAGAPAVSRRENMDGRIASSLREREAGWKQRAETKPAGGNWRERNQTPFVHAPLIFSLFYFV